MNIKCDVKKDYRTKSYNKYNLYCMTNGSYEKIHIGEKNGIMVNMIDDKKVLMKNVNARIGNGVTQKKALFFRASSNDGGQYIIDNVYKIINLMSIMFFIKTDFFGEKFNVRRNVPSKCYIVKVGNNFGIYITSYETRNSKIKIGIETGNKNQEFELNISYSSMLMNDLTHIGIFISINSVVLYINGIKVNSQQFKLNRNMNNSDNSKISFGRDFKGLIEDFRLSLSNNLKSNILTMYNKLVKEQQYKVYFNNKYKSERIGKNIVFKNSNFMYDDIDIKAIKRNKILTYARVSDKIDIDVSSEDNWTIVFVGTWSLNNNKLKTNIGLDDGYVGYLKIGNNVITLDKNKINKLNFYPPMIHIISQEKKNNKYMHRYYLNGIDMTKTYVNIDQKMSKFTINDNSILDIYDMLYFKKLLNKNEMLKLVNILSIKNGFNYKYEYIGKKNYAKISGKKINKTNLRYYDCFEECHKDNECVSFVLTPNDLYNNNNTCELLYE